MEPFIESGMTFGPYDEGYCFRIEISVTYQSIRQNLQMAEFLLYRPSSFGKAQVWIVEAKQSSPRPETQPTFSDWIGEIRAKLSNALALSVISICGRHPLAVSEIPAVFQNLDLATMKFRLVLVIKGHKKSWLPPLQDALRRELHDIVKTWALGPNSIVVINHEQALSCGLISSHDVL